MGQEESKPTFPTDQQWVNWQKEKKLIIDAKVEETKKQQDILARKDVIQSLELFENYMAQCHDRSKIKQFFMDNDQCTKARAEVVQHVVDKMTYHVSVSSTIEELKAMKK